MKDIIINILSVLGSLGLFLFGMKLMSEALQKVAGLKIRNFLAAATSNPIKGMFTGLSITGIIQSSSATTVMIVGFVNAGLLSLSESISLIIGANIGTTITPWLVTLGTSKSLLSLITLPLIGVMIPLIFSRKNSLAYWGEFIIGFAIIFISLNFIQEFIPDIRTNPQEYFNENPGIQALVKRYNHFGVASVLLFFAVGMVLTIVLQSSSVTISLTMIMCASGWISIDLAAAMILGENIGTTVTANFAALVANKSAKRAALAHFIFNLGGVIWCLILLKFMIRFIDTGITSISGHSIYENEGAMKIGLAIFHTMFNVMNSMIFIWLIPQLVKLTNIVYKTKSVEEEKFILRHIKTGLLSTSEISMLQARKEIFNYAKRTVRMYQLFRKLFSEINDTNFTNIFKEIREYEKMSDITQMEIATYLSKLSEDELSKSSTDRIRIMLGIVDGLENIADDCYSLSKTIRRKKKHKIWFTQDIRDNLKILFDYLQEALDVMLDNLNREYSLADFEKAQEIEKKINKYRKELKRSLLDNIEDKSYTYQAGVIYNDIFTLSEQLGDYIVNISEILVEKE